MSLKIRALAVVASAVLASGAGVAATWTAAQASTPGCAFSNGCATLHGTDANGVTVAMDAKHQNKAEILIGYPDNVGDGATSFDGVLHYTRATSTTTWDDTEVVPVSAPVATHSGPGSPAITSFAFVPATGTWEFHVTGPSGPYTATVSGLPGATVTSPITSGLGYNGTLSVNGAANAPGLYDNVTLTLTNSATPTPQTTTYTIAVNIIAHQVTIPGGNTPFYTFVYAPAGDWTSQCVTDINGSGALRLEACTLGHNVGQDFTVGSINGLLSGSQAHVSNLLAAAVGASSCLTDPSTSNAAIPQSDAADELAPGGRQLYVNGSCAANVNLWSWGT